MLYLLWKWQCPVFVREPIDGVLKQLLITRCLCAVLTVSSDTWLSRTRSNEEEGSFRVCNQSFRGITIVIIVIMIRGRPVRAQDRVKV